MTRRLIGLFLVLNLAWACSGTPPRSPATSLATAEAPPAGGEEFEAAGIFAVSRHEGTVQVLLGLDAHTGRWADFVGYRKERETAAQTSIREFTEETRGAYRSEVTAESLAASSGGPHRVGAVRIFLLEIPFKEAGLLAGLAVSRDTEKTHYCWVDLRVLIDSIDNSAEPASVPPRCDSSGVDGRLRVRTVTAANLRLGGVLREPLDRLLAK